MHELLVSFQLLSYLQFAMRIRIRLKGKDLVLCLYG